MSKHGSGEFGGQEPEQSLVERIGVAAVSQASGDPGQRQEQHRNVGEYFAAVIAGVITDEEVNDLGGSASHELFRTGVFAARDGNRYGVAVARGNVTGDRFAIEPEGGSRPDMSRTLYMELPLANGRPDRVIRVTLDPITSKNLPQDLDGFVWRKEMGLLDQIVQGTHWGPTQVQPVDSQGGGSMDNVQQPFARRQIGEA